MIAKGMAPAAALLLLLLAYGSCMEMRETVERVVMVRTTGSDLQPAATGYLYKKENDGAASVIKMGETEVMDHFSKLYGKSEAYKAPLPTPNGPFHNKEEVEVKAASHPSEEQVKPVVEKVEEQDHIDGLADEDYDKMFEEYAKEFGHYKNDFSDYLHGVGHYDHGIYHGKDDSGKDYGLKGYYGHEGTGNDGHKKDYHSEKHEAYSISKQKGHKQDYADSDGHGKHYPQLQGYRGDDHEHLGANSERHGIDGFREKLYDQKAFKKDNDFYDGEGVKGGLHKYAVGYTGYGSGGRGYGGAYDSGHDAGAFGKDRFVGKHFGDADHEGYSSHEHAVSGHHGDFGAKDDEFGDKSYGYKIKH